MQRASLRALRSGVMALGAWLLAGALLGGCAHTNASGEAMAEEAAFQAAIRQMPAPSDYQIGPTDLLDIRIYEQLELDRTVRVSQNGIISLPLIGEVPVGGMSVIEAEAAISRRLKDYLVAPQVSVFVRDYGSKRVFVMGEVKRPGAFPLPLESKLTVLEAISLAEGFTPVANQDRTRVIRVVQGRSQSYSIAVSDITKRGHKEKDLVLESGDVVWVPQSFF